MRSSRLLLVVPAVSALVFTGVGPATAHDGHHHNGNNDVEIVDILRVEITEDDEAEVYFTYKCDEDTKDLEAAARVRQDDARYSGREDVKDCEEGETQTDSVTVTERRGGELDADEDAKVTVTLYEDDERVDRETDDDVDVEDERNGNGKDKDHDHDHDKDHHGHHGHH